VMATSEPGLFVRVDDRLIHGQVVTTWVRHLSTSVIWVVSDRARAEPIEVVLLKSSVPPDLTLEVYSLQEAASAWTRFSGRRLLLLFERLEDVVQAFDLHVPVCSVNLGGLRYRPGSVALTKAVYIGESESHSLQHMETRGIRTTIQMLPHDRKIDVYELFRGKSR